MRSTSDTKLGRESQIVWVGNELGRKDECVDRDLAWIVVSLVAPSDVVMESNLPMFWTPLVVVCQVMSPVQAF